MIALIIKIKRVHMKRLNIIYLSTRCICSAVRFFSWYLYSAFIATIRFFRIHLRFNSETFEHKTFKTHFLVISFEHRTLSRADRLLSCSFLALFDRIPWVRLSQVELNATWCLAGWLPWDRVCCRWPTVDRWVQRDAAEIYSSLCCSEQRRATLD